MRPEVGDRVLVVVDFANSWGGRRGVVFSHGKGIAFVRFDDGLEMWFRFHELRLLDPVERLAELA